jgi:hypothetical protein
MRRNLPLPDASLSAPPVPLVLHDDAVFTLEQLRQALGLRSRTLPREVRGGRLKVNKRAGRYFIFGSDVKAWLRAGAIQKDSGQAGN